MGISPNLASWQARGGNEDLAKSWKIFREVFQVSVSGLWTLQGRGLWKRWSCQWSLVPQVTREKWEEKPYSKENKERELFPRWSNKIWRFAWNMYLVSPRAKILKISFEKVKSSTMLRKDGFFHRQEWPASTCTCCREASTQLIPLPSARLQSLSQPSCKNCSKQSPPLLFSSSCWIWAPTQPKKTLPAAQNLESNPWNKFTS